MLCSYVRIYGQVGMCLYLLPYYLSEDGASLARLPRFLLLGELSTRCPLSLSGDRDRAESHTSHHLISSPCLIKVIWVYTCLDTWIHVGVVRKEGSLDG